MQIFFRWSHNPFLSFVVVAVIFVLAYLSYRKAASEKTLILLFTLRALALLLLVFCISQPVLKFVETTTERVYVSLLIDTSKSMGLKDEIDGERRVLKLRRALFDSGVLKKLLSRCEVKCFEFSSGISECTLSEMEAIEETRGNSTDIAGAINAVVSELKGQLLSGIIILSDGQDNSGKDPLDLVKHFRIPIYTVGIGGKEETGEKDIEVYRVSANKRAIVNNLTQVEVMIRSKNFENKPVPVDIILGEQVLASSVITLSSHKPTHKVKLAFVPKEVGRFVYTVRVPSDEEEISMENNQRYFSMQVTDPGIRVLYLEGTPRWEYKFLKRELERDVSIRFTSFLRIGTGRLLKQGDAGSIKIPENIGEIREYDIIIFGDIEKDFFTQAQLEAVKTLVSEGGAFVMLGGNNSFGAGRYHRSPIEEILPVVISGDRRVNEEFKLELTGNGLAHPIFHSITGEELPSLLGCNIVSSAKPGATILAVNGELIVVAVQNFGQGKTIAITTDSTWRWSLSGAGSGNFSLFWRQLLRWLHPEEKRELKEEEKLVQVIMDRDNYFCGDRVYITVRVLDERELTNVKCLVNTPDGKEVKLTMNSGPEGFSATFVPLKRGIYKIKAEASRKGEKASGDTISFIAEEPSLEFVNTKLNDQLLSKLSRESGGQYYTPETIWKLPDDIVILEETVTCVREKKLWNNPWLFIGFLALLTLEWTIRKRQQLM